MDTLKIKCQHHWQIEKAAGPFSIGICRFCGKKKEFKNFIPEQPKPQTTIN